jgi:hypothetical protein
LKISRRRESGVSPLGRVTPLVERLEAKILPLPRVELKKIKVPFDISRLLLP